MIEHRTPEVLVTDKAVYFDGWELPWFIAKDGISFTPGGSDDINRLTVEFFVGTTTFRDAWQTTHEEEWHWLGRLLELGALFEHYEFDRIEKEFDVRG
ncbi:hypothetical protein SEA_ARCHERNM_39 [Mycobacterium phage ArcherNM]|uniref:hypothetical protein n=1 Tax=Mycobacterium phage ArcherNM TaxID=1815972 RepID=UPI00078E228F|nr:hypothetical protein BJD71_gp39 [Mycobacterium phage ArcherNM]AMS01033.1 hypothetical protein SEA_ARCHERNM_39 [Mycobacterium phage ArcherNM]